MIRSTPYRGCCGCLVAARRRYTKLVCKQASGRGLYRCSKRTQPRNRASLFMLAPAKAHAAGWIRRVWPGTAAGAAAPQQCAGCRPRPTGRKAVAARPPCTLRRPDRAPASSPVVCPLWLTVATKSLPKCLSGSRGHPGRSPIIQRAAVPTIQLFTLALKRVNPYSAAAGEAPAGSRSATARTRLIALAQGCRWRQLSSTPFEQRPDHPAASDALGAAGGSRQQDVGESEPSTGMCCRAACQTHRNRP